MNGSVGVENHSVDGTLVAEDEGHPGDDDDAYSVGSRTRIRLSHTDQTKHSRCSGERLLSPVHNLHLSSRSLYHSAPHSSGACTAENFTETETGLPMCHIDQPTFNGDVFIFDHESTTVNGEKSNDERIGISNSSDPDVSSFRYAIIMQTDVF